MRGKRGETATIFLPSVPQLLELASEMEKQREHLWSFPGSAEDGLWDDDLLAAANREETASNLLEGPGFAALESDALFDRALFDVASSGLERR